MYLLPIPVMIGLMSNYLSGRMQALFCSLQTFSVGKRRLCFPLQINGARRLGRRLFHTLCFEQDPGINLSAVSSSQSSTGHGQASVKCLARPSWKHSAHWYLAAVSTRYFFRRKITTYWITSLSSNITILWWSFARHSPAHQISWDQSSN